MRCALLLALVLVVGCGGGGGGEKITPPPVTTQMVGLYDGTVKIEGASIGSATLFVRDDRTVVVAIDSPSESAPDTIEGSINEGAFAAIVTYPSGRTENWGGVVTGTDAARTITFNTGYTLTARVYSWGGRYSIGRGVQPTGANEGGESIITARREFLSDFSATTTMSGIFTAGGTLTGSHVSEFGTVPFTAQFFKYDGNGRVIFHFRAAMTGHEERDQYLFIEPISG